MPVAAGRRQRGRATTQRRRHGLTSREIEALRARQLHCCAICGRPDGPGDASLEVDHDHRHCSGTEGCRRCVRGLLCGPCNRSLGRIGDQHVGRLIVYLGGELP